MKPGLLLFKGHVYSYSNILHIVPLLSPVSLLSCQVADKTKKIMSFTRNEVIKRGVNWEILCKPIEDKPLNLGNLITICCRYVGPTKLNALS